MRTSGATPGMIFRPVTKNSSSRIRKSPGSRSATFKEFSPRSNGTAACLIANFAGSAAMTIGGISVRRIQEMYSQPCCNASVLPKLSSSRDPRSRRSVPSRPPAKCWIPSARAKLLSETRSARTRSCPNRAITSLSRRAGGSGDREVPPEMTDDPGDARFPPIPVANSPIGPRVCSVVAAMALAGARSGRAIFRRATLRTMRRRLLSFAFLVIFVCPLLRADVREARKTFLRARVAVAEGRFREALELYRKVLAEIPDDAVVHYEYAQLLRDLNVGEEAVDQARQAVRLDPSLPEAHRLLGTLELAGSAKDSTRLDHAIGELQEAHKLSPGDVATTATLARALLARGR